MRLYDYLTPKLDSNSNLTTANRFFTNDDWRCGRFENFESDHHYESNPESEVRFKIESNLEASQVPSLQVSPKLFGVNSWIPQMIRQWIPDSWLSCLRTCPSHLCFLCQISMFLALLAHSNTSLFLTYCQCFLLRPHFKCFQQDFYLLQLMFRSVQCYIPLNHDLQNVH